METINNAAIGWSIAIVAIAIVISFYGQSTMPTIENVAISLVQENKIFFTLQGDDAIGNISGKTFGAGPKMTYIASSQVGKMPFWIEIPKNH